ncbi:MAG: molybdate ABC transporter substrate-binding protein [Syntrophomonadaceae bacterium]|nr:molybdate ABC transporter substrate-binding protein [Syntrophomonadaceae bacterium]MDD3270586.1 molybdate ABC transporter substrate-binding protein [Syntrophomonadaceae bacterium]MDD3897988.1 molybdate ABC transporter substrate-binding protein [Syntrophomonadaceae bacterium]MDD4561574.1 molybdate ABC transporter substrate-binding protein [Syntrophomonadaceae bacterium]
MKKIRLYTVLLIAVFLMSVFSLTGCSKSGDTDNNVPKKDTEQKQTLQYEGQTLLVYSGAGLSKAMDEMGQAFEQKYGAKINYNYAGCAQLLGQMEINKTGDVFVGGSLNDMKIAKEKGFADKYYEVVYHIPAIAVPKGNPAGISELADLAKPGVKLVLGDAKSNAIGKKGEKIFTQNGLTEGIAKNVVARDATVNEIVTHIAMKQGDAGLVWEDNGAANKDIEIITIPKEQNIIDTVPVCVLSFTEKQELAQVFVDFINSQEGREIFANHGFKPIE